MSHAISQNKMGNWESHFPFPISLFGGPMRMQQIIELLGAGIPIMQLNGKPNCTIGK